MGYPSPKLSNLLHGVVYRYEEGEITAEEAVQHVALFGGEHGTTSVGVEIIGKEHAYQGTTNTIAVWLIQKGVPESDLGIFGPHVVGLVPVSLLNDLSLRSDVTRINGPDIGRVETMEWDSEAAPSQETLEKFGMKPNTQQRAIPTPTPMPTASDDDGIPQTPEEWMTEGFNTEPGLQAKGSHTPHQLAAPTAQPVPTPTP